MKKRLAICVALIMMLTTGCGKANEITLHLSYGDRTGTYEGDVNADGMPDGQGTFSTTNDEGEVWTYTGAFVNGHFEGEGETTWQSGWKEVGTYHDDFLQPEPNEEIAKLYKSPDEYVGHCFEIVGRVFNVIGYTDGQLSFQVNQDIENNDNNTIVYYDENIEISENDYVRIVGLAQGSQEFENALGGTISAVAIYASEVEVLDYKDAVMPTLKEVNVNQTVDQYGYKVTIEKVEFSEKETRVYVSVKNEGSSTFSIFSFNALAIQNGRQYEQEDNWNADYPVIQSDLRPGTMTEGVLVFNGLEQQDFRVIMEAYSDNYDEDISDYEFDISVD